jgi:hypothetical protein
VIPALPGSEFADGHCQQPVAYLATLSRIIDGVRPGALIVRSPGQMTAQG